MARNGVGTYTLPGGNPVAPSTVILSSVFNATMTDIGTEITNSLPRDGQAPMSGVLKLIDGTSTNPALSFNSDSATGFFRPAANTFGQVVAGVEVVRYTSTGANLVGQTADDGVNRLQVTGGTKLTGTLTVTGASTLTGGVAGTLNLTSASARITGDFSNATQASRTLFQSSTTNGNTEVGLVPNGTSVSTYLNLFNNASPTNAGVMQLGSDGTAGYVRQAITGSGTYLPIVFSTNNAERMRIDTAGAVGIGTTPTFGKLHVKAVTDCQVTADGAAGYGAFYARGSSTNPAYLFLGNVTSGEQNRITSLNGGTLIFGTGNVGSETFRIDNGGRVSGLGLHNNGSGIGGTALQYLGSGSYTPAGTVGTNVASVTPAKALYTRIGNVVHVTGTVSAVSSAATGAKTFYLSLPLASNLAATTDLSGAIGQTSNTGDPVGPAVVADPTNDRAQVNYNTAFGSGTHTFGYSYSYEML